MTYDDADKEASTTTLTLSSKNESFFLLTLTQELAQGAG